MIYSAAKLLQVPADDLAQVGPARIEIGSGVRASLAQIAAALAPRKIALLVDQTKIAAPDSDLKAWAGETLGGIGQVTTVVLPASTSADESAVIQAKTGCAGADLVVSVGSGTISDIGKVAAGERPHVIVQTAASVNGYSDDESVLLKAGVKRTEISHYAHALLIDTEVLALAPKRLNRSGLGDTISMFTAVADWYLAHQVGMNDRWSQTAAWVHLRHGGQTLAAARGIGESSAAELEFLAKMLTISGLSMGMARQTSPSSGMEHTVSHMLDMWASAHTQPHQLHGAQVGVTTLWAALLWRRVRKLLDAGEFPEVSVPDTAKQERLVKSVFDRIDPSGRSAAECWSDYSAKLDRYLAIGLPVRVKAFTADWPKHRAFLDQCLRDPAELAAALNDAGAIAKSTELTTPQTALWALTNSHLMRNRFNVCDLAYAAGLWTPDVAAEIIAEADALSA
ncbi:MAG: iron-containing alcohol dehydrogenase [Propionibacteriaceae bacterium]|jgi:glycerol-1-phosphate dehydrogenase [NAD(P)+]|nr:iron-containing alcohol dehydrogenase [Propionibacteriaceae bacterium]